MRLDPNIRKFLDQSVLCWLATASKDGQPNVSPKEAFCAFGQEEIIIANIASPKTRKNILANPLVCVSFIDVLVQKGYQLKGIATCVEAKDPEFNEMEKVLQETLCGKFPFKSVFKIFINSAKPIIAPSYLLYPESTSEQQQIENAKKQYKLY